MLKNLYDLDSILNDNYRRLDPEIVDQLVDSILEVGLQEPIHLFQIMETGELYVVSGHHRLEAIRRIKSNPVHADKVFQAHVTRGSQREYLSQETAVKAVMANSMRKNMRLIEKAGAFQKLIQVGLSPEDIAKMVNLDSVQVSKILSVAALREEVKDFIYDNPKLKDSVLFKMALRFEQDPNFDVREALEEVLHKKPMRQGAKAPPKWKPKLIKSRLESTGSFTPQQIDQILKCIDPKMS